MRLFLLRVAVTHPPEVDDGYPHSGEEFVEPLQLLKQDDGGRRNVDAELLPDFVVLEIRRKLVQQIPEEVRSSERRQQQQQQQ